MTQNITTHTDDQRLQTGAISVEPICVHEIHTVMDHIWKTQVCLNETTATEIVIDSV